jgi:ADP-heptose:LPS heptosyltransferase
MKPALPPPETVENFFIWHNGALGDLLLAGPALQALSRAYHKSRVTGVGQPGLWNLLKETLRVETVWDGGAGLWAPLFSSAGPLPLPLSERLSGVSMALVFSPKPNQDFLKRLNQAGVREALWAPSFPENGQEPVRLLQARHLHALGFSYEPEPFYLTPDAVQDEAPAGIFSDKPLLTVAPGSGSPQKNWPLSNYYELTRALAWEYGLQVAWLAGPAETAWLSYLQGLAESQGHSLLINRPLRQVAGVLARTHLYIGGDSGITHLAAAARARRVLALFGPTDPKVWAPFGPQVAILAETGDGTPGRGARKISCPASPSLSGISHQKVMEAAARLLEESGVQKRN